MISVDKDVFVCVVSQMTEALDRGREYPRFGDAFERLRGATFKTNIKTGGKPTKDIFCLIDRATIVNKSDDWHARMIVVELTFGPDHHNNSC